MRLAFAFLFSCVEYDQIKDGRARDTIEDSPTDSTDSADEPEETGEAPVITDCAVVAALPGSTPMDEACVVWAAGPVTDPWNLVIEWQYNASGEGVMVMPTVGNLTDDNGDGEIDERDTPEIVFTTWLADTLAVVDGKTGAELFELPEFSGNAGTAIADVDRDGMPEVVAMTSDDRVAAVSADGVIAWTSETFEDLDYPQPTVADLDDDGDVEIVYDKAIVDGATGDTIGTLSGFDRGWRTPVVADLDQDGQQEIILSDAVYDAQGRKLWESDAPGEGRFNAVADIDGDIGGEVFFTSDREIYLHDDDGTPLTSWRLPGDELGPPCVADFDGDGAVEIAVNSATFFSVWEVDGTELWREGISDYSGAAGCSAYDFDGDGAYEILFADEEDLYIFDGATGLVNYSNNNHNSGTLWEYPVVADVDHDGSAEIILASAKGRWEGITVIGHATNGLAPSGASWGTHDFSGANLYPDGTVPSPPVAPWLTHNLFRGRPTVDDTLLSATDLSVEITDTCITSCGVTGALQLAWQVGNPGTTDVEAGALLSLYVSAGGAWTLYDTYTLDAIPAGSTLAGDTLEIPIGEVTPGGVRLRVDDNGTGAGALPECDESNNTAWLAGICV